MFITVMTLEMWSDCMHSYFQSKQCHDTLGPKHGAVGMQRWGDGSEPSFTSQLPNPSSFQEAAVLQTSSRDVLSHCTTGGRMQKNQWAASIYCNGLLFGSMGFFLLLITMQSTVQRQHLKLKGNKIPSLQGMKATH